MSLVSTRRIERGCTSGSHQLRAAGFTLVEVLVVLMLVALLSGVLLSGLERVLDIRGRLATFLDGAEAPVLISDWFRSTVEGLVPDTDTGRDRFVGEMRRFSGLSLAPLNQSRGVPIRITWDLVFDARAGRTYLQYRNGTQAPLTLASWLGEAGRLLYCGPDLTCDNGWTTNPTPSKQEEKQAQVPTLIRPRSGQG